MLGPMKNRALILVGAALLVGFLALPGCNTPFFQDSRTELVEFGERLDELTERVQSGEVELDDAGRAALQDLKDTLKDLERRMREEADQFGSRVPDAMWDAWGAFQAGGAGAGLIALIVGLFKPSRREQDQKIELAKSDVMEKRTQTRQDLVAQVADLKAQLELLKPSPSMPAHLAGGAFPSSRPPSQA